MTAPPNDNIADAITLTVGSGSLGPYTIDDATTEGGEPSTGGGTGSNHQSIWFKFTALAAGTVHLSTQGSLAGDAGSGDGLPHGPFGSLDTKLTVWSGATYPTGVVSNNDDSASDPEEGYWSELTFGFGAGGTTYWIQVATWDSGYTGTVILSWEGIPAESTEEPPPELLPCLDYPTWGLFPGGEAPPVTPGGGESAGYVEAGLNNLIFENTPPAGALLLATTRRYSYAGSLPATGTLAGFGATWTRLSYQEASGNLGNAFSELWWALEPSYTSGRLRYTFPAGSDYDMTYSSVFYEAFTGVDPALPFQNVEEFDPTTGTSAAWSHSLMSPSSLMFTAFYAMDSALTNQTITPTVTPLDTHSASQETPPIGSGGLPVPVDPQRGTQEYFEVVGGPDYGFTFTDTSNARTWWAVALEVMADPDCAAVAYWGINATTPA